MASITSEPLSQDEIDRLEPVYKPILQKGQSFIRTIPGCVTLPLAFDKYQRQIKNWQVRQDDVYVLTFPKSGTTWTQELVWLLHSDCNFEEAKAVPLDRRFPFMEFNVLYDFAMEELPQWATYFNTGADYFKAFDKMPSPRFIKSHLHLCLLPDDLLERGKAVICLRNPKDTVVSFYHHQKLMKPFGYTGDFPTYFDLFMDNLVVYSPYFKYVREAWQLRSHPSVCLLFFEDMKKDMASTVKKVAKFLGKTVSDEEVEAVAGHLSFKQMRNNPAVNKEERKKLGLFTGEGCLMRKGEVGDWKNYFTDEMNRRMDEAIERHFKPIGLEFQYE